jgi:hypothetical protein
MYDMTLTTVQRLTLELHVDLVLRAELLVRHAPARRRQVARRDDTLKQQVPITAVSWADQMNNLNFLNTPSNMHDKG